MKSLITCETVVAAFILVVLEFKISDACLCTTLPGVLTHKDVSVVAHSAVPSVHSSISEQDEP